MKCTNQSVFQCVVYDVASIDKLLCDAARVFICAAWRTRGEKVEKLPSELSCADTEVSLVPERLCLSSGKEWVWVWRTYIRETFPLWQLDTAPNLKPGWGQAPVSLECGSKRRQPWAVPVERTWALSCIVFPSSAWIGCLQAVPGTAFLMALVRLMDYNRGLAQSERVSSTESFH